MPTCSMRPSLTTTISSATSKRLLLVVRDEHRGDGDLVVQAAQPVAQLLADLRVERAERLVEQEDARADRERAGERHPLALPAGELRGQSVREALEVHEPQELVDALGDLGLRRAADLEPERDVPRDGQVLEGRVVLEDEAHVATTRGQVRGVAALDLDLAGVRHPSPATTRSSVDLPPPLGPSSAVRRPVGTETETSSSATKSPKVLRTSRISMLMRRPPWGGGAGGPEGAGEIAVRGAAGPGAGGVVGAQERHGDDARHGHRREEERDGVGGALLEVLVPLLDEQRGRLRAALEVAGDDLDRAELAEGAREREHDAVDDGPPDRRQGDAPERLEAARPEARRGELLVGAELREDRHDLADDEREAHERGGEDDARRREDHLEPGVLEARRRTSRSSRTRGRARARRRSGRRTAEVEQGVEEGLAREVVPDDEHRDADPEHGVEEHDLHRDGRGELEREDDGRVGEGTLERLEPVGERAAHDERDRPPDEQHEIDDDGGAQRAAHPGRAIHGGPPCAGGAGSSR